MFYFSVFPLNSVVEFAPIVVHGRLVPELHRDGMPTIRSAIHAISKGTKDSPAQFVSAHTGQPPTEKWSNVVCAISK